ncbi:MAG TPA: hypothetical protein VMU95_20360 [Trebonia sp.]|nr:hypothetical protein [Trebonia sp.]
MSTFAGSKLSFLRFRAWRRRRAQCPARPDNAYQTDRESPGPGLGALVRMPEHSAPTAAMPGSRPTAPSAPRVPCVPPPTMLARTLPDASLLTPAATVPTVLVPVMRTPGPPVCEQEVPSEGSETTTLPSRRDAPATTIHPRRSH